MMMVVICGCDDDGYNTLVICLLYCNSEHVRTKTVSFSLKQKDLSISCPERRPVVNYLFGQYYLRGIPVRFWFEMARSLK